MSSVRPVATIGANHHGSIDVLNTLLVANADSSATLSTSIVNKTGSDQALAAVTVKTFDGTELPVASMKMLLPLTRDLLAPVGGASDAGGFRVLKGTKAGSYVRVTLSFTDAPPVTIEAPVVTRTPMYDTVSG